MRVWTFDKFYKDIESGKKRVAYTVSACTGKPLNFSIGGCNFSRDYFSERQVETLLSAGVKLLTPQRLRAFTRNEIIRSRK